MVDILKELTELGISKNSNFEETKTAFRKLFRKFHPDTSNLPSDEAENSFIQTKEKYDSFLRLGVASLFEETSPKKTKKQKLSKEKILNVLQEYVKFLAKSAQNIKNHNSIFTDSLPLLIDICNKLNIDFKEYLLPLFEAIYLAQIDYLKKIIQKNNLQEIEMNKIFFTGLIYLGKLTKKDFISDIRSLAVEVLTSNLKKIVKTKNKGLQQKQLSSLIKIIKSIGLTEKEINTIIFKALK